MDVVATHDDAPRGLGAVAPLQHVVIFKQYQIQNLLIKYDTSKEYSAFQNAHSTVFCYSYFILST